MAGIQPGFRIDKVFLGKNNTYISSDSQDNLIFSDDYVKTELGKEYITLKEIYSRVKGIYTNSKGQLVFRDEYSKKEITLESILNSCQKWRNNIVTGSLFWMGHVETDHFACANIPRKYDTLDLTNRYWSIDKFLYILSTKNIITNCNIDEIVSKSNLFIDSFTNEWIWYDVPGVEIVLPPIDGNKVGQIMAKLAFVADSSPEPITFRLYNQTLQKELTRSVVIQGNSKSVSFPTTLLYQGKMPTSVECTKVENCGCVNLDCTSPDQMCKNSVIDNVVSRVYATGSNLIKVQFHVNEYKPDHWQRYFGVEIDGTYLGKSTINAIIFDADRNAKYGKNHGTAEFNKQSSVQVKFSQPLLTTEYAITLSPNKNINCWWENKTINGFNIASELPFTGQVDWTAININAN